MQVSFHDLRKRTPESEQRADRATQPAAAGPALTLFLGNGFLLENDLYRYFAESRMAAHPSSFAAAHAGTQKYVAL
jgi:hypothetical protein